MMWRVSGLLLVVFLAGCSTYTLVKPGTVKVGDFYSVEPSMEWSSLKRGDVELWTVDGPLLAALRFTNGVEEGKPVLDIAGVEHKPEFRADMSETELVELVVDAITLSGGQRVAARDLRPTEFGKLDGFRFEVDYLNADGLECQGLVVGTVSNERLYLVIYTGAKIYYYPKYLQEVEAIIRSIMVTGKA